MSLIENVKVVGFDLDQTLYIKSAEIDEEIQKYIYEVLSRDKKCSIEDAKQMFCSHYPELSGSKSLMKLGYERSDAKEIVQEAVARADVSRFLEPSLDVLNLLKAIKEKYGSLSLITASNIENSVSKLNKLEIPIELFDYFSAGEYSKSDGTAYEKWIEKFLENDSSLKPENFLYIGDRKTSDSVVPGKLGIKSILVNVDKIEQDYDVLQLSKLLDLKDVLFE